MLAIVWEFRWHLFTGACAVTLVYWLMLVAAGRLK